MRTVMLALALAGCYAASAQQEKNSLSFGGFYSSPLNEPKYRNILKPGVGIELTFEPRISNRHSILMQGSLATYKANETWLFHEEDKINIGAFKLCYRYYLIPDGFYLNGGPGVDYYTDYEPIAFSFTAGAGKRFLLNERFFLDAGVDYIDGSTEKRIHLKVAIGKFRKPSRITSAETK